MTNSMLISCIIVTYNNASEIEAFFSALHTTAYYPIEVIVVDNASQDTTLEGVRSHWPTAHIIANIDNKGFGAACNQGADIAQGEYLIFLNADVQVQSVWLTDLIKTVQEHPEIGLWAPTTLYPQQQPPTFTEIIDYVPAVPGCALLVSKALFIKLGGFDERMFLYWEDTELCWRAWLLGYAVAAHMGAYVVHERGASTGFQRWDAETTKNSLYTYLKLMRWTTVLRFMLSTLLVSIGKTLLGRWQVWKGWWWVICHFFTIIAERRRFFALKPHSHAALEAMIEQHTQKLEQERRMYRTL